MPSLQDQRLASWSRDDVLALLSLLNHYVTEIRDMISRDEDKGIDRVSEFLGNKLGDHCNRARVKSKIARLYTHCGSPDSDPYDVYKHGAYTRTLPGLDQKYPGMLKDLASRVKVLQRWAPSLELYNSSIADAESNTREEQIETENLRRSKRMANAARDRDPLTCRCGFTHNDFCLPCSTCRSWQHGYCYYKSDTIEKLPDDHRCDECQLKDHVSADRHQVSELPNKFENLQIKDEDAQERHIRRRQYCALIHFGEDENVIWGPMDEEIVEQFQSLVFRIRNIASWIPRMDDVLEKRLWEHVTKYKPLLDLFKVCFGMDEAEKIQSLLAVTDPVDILRAIIAAAVTNWSFYQTPHETQTIEGLVCEIYQELTLLKDGHKVLRALHRTAWNRITEDRSGSLQRVLSKEANLLAVRLMTVLRPLIFQDKALQPPCMVESWIENHRHRQELLRLIVELFSRSLKIKVDLPTTDKCYEIFFPVAGMTFNADLMTTEIGQPQNMDDSKEFKVELCFMPAVIECDVKTKGDNTEEQERLFGAHNFIKTSEINRGAGRIIRPAVVQVG